MAERRMFAKSIVLSDAFLDMPMSARCLYFTLGMLADDDGFIGNPKSIMRQCGASQDDMLMLLQKRYLLTFDSGVIVIKHWRMNNFLRNDRHISTTYLEEKATLTLDDKGSYTEKNEFGIPSDNQVTTKCQPPGIPSIGKDSIDKISIGKDTTTTLMKKKHKYGEYGHVLLTNDEAVKLQEEYGVVKTQDAIKYLDEYIEMKGAKYKSHYMALRKWVFDAVDEKKIHKGTNNASGNIFLDIAKDEGIV